MRTIEQILADLQAIIDGARETENGQETERPLTDEEVQRYEALETELATVRRDVEFRTRHNAYRTPNRTDLHIHAGGIEQATETDEDRAFRSYLRSGIPNQDLTPGNADVEFRAQAEGTGAAGGYLVPTGFLNKITERLKAFGGFAALAEEVNTGNGNPLPWPTNDDTANSGEIVAENAAPAGGADLVFGTQQLGAYKYNSNGTGGLPLKVPFELAQDSAFPIENFVQTKLGQRIGRKQATDWINGTGVGMPQGVRTGATSALTVASNAVGLTYPNFVTLSHVPDVAYREAGECVWVMHDSVMALAEGLVDGNGRPLLQNSTDGISGKPEMRILGYRVVIDNSMPSAYTTGSKTVLFGNMKMAYVIRRVKEVTMIVLRELYAVNGQIGYMAWARADGLVQDANALTAASGL